MSKVKYKYNPRTLSYDRVELGLADRLKKLLTFTTAGLVFGAAFTFITYSFIDSPKEKKLKRENAQLQFQYELLGKRLDQVAVVLEDIQKRDDNIYRVIFEAEPIPGNIRKAGFGGINRYKDLQGFGNSDLLIKTTKRLDQVAKQLYIQSKSFDEVIEMARQKEKMLASIPAIQPISNADLTRIASGFGYRIDPVYKSTKFHYGMDFTAPKGTEIYSTGSGKVVKVNRSQKGLGYHVVIDHGYGYQTVYGHMSKFNVRRGAKVKRGDVIGFVGNTGKSVGPHLHYEVHKNGKKINPVNFYFNDLTPEEYEEIIQISSVANQSFD